MNIRRFSVLYATGRSKHAQQILLAIWIGALALPLAACNDPQETVYGRADLRAFAHLARAAKIVDADRQCRHRDRLAGRRQAHAAKGMAVNAFATGLDHPRTLYVLPNGDVLVAETNAPPKPDDSQGHQGLDHQNGDGPRRRRHRRARTASRCCATPMVTASPKPEASFSKGFNSPFGMALVGDDFYVADSDAILKFPYHAGDTKITARRRQARRPARRHPSIITGPRISTASPDGRKLYATVGSNSNVGENGIEAETNRAAVLEVDRATGASRVFASGLRNPNGPSWQPQSGALWVAVNERDELGNDLVPDYMTSVKDGGFYGWPYSYYGQHVDVRVEPQRPDLVAKAIAPDYALGAHTASLGLTFNTGSLFPPEMAGGAFVGQHGSWNRKPRAGYKVIFVPFADGKPSGEPQDVLTGFLNANGEAQGRPVGVAIDKQGALLVADDVGNTVWRVTPAAKISARYVDRRGEDSSVCCFIWQRTSLAGVTDVSYGRAK